MSNYPPGVTGNEYAIAGPDTERDEDRDVTCGNAECDFSGTVEVMVTTFRRDAWCNWTCPACGADNQEDLPEVEDDRDYEPDYDDDYEPDYWP
jgi:hypothetical protein